MLASVSQKLGLEGSVGVADIHEIGAVMTNRKLIAGIQFSHFTVRIFKRISAYLNSSID